jgi:hypothetical protein
MRLADRVAQCRTPFIVVCNSTGERTRLSGASDCANDVAACPIRYVLSDELTRLCAALAFSKGAQTLACTDLIRVPAQRLWVEWTHAPWRDELQRYGFPSGDSSGECGRRGALLNASSDGRRGSVRTFWCMGNEELDVFASPLEAKFDFDATEIDRHLDSTAGAIRVIDDHSHKGSALGTCFSFDFEKTWADYYYRYHLAATAQQQLERHSLGTIALDIPVLLAFFLMLNTRSGLPQRRSQLERLNRSRHRSGKAPLLEHVEVHAPFACGHIFPAKDSHESGRRRPRLHHVRGHLVRRRNELFWRVPHLRGHASSGVVKTRTVTWAFDQT